MTMEKVLHQMPAYAGREAARPGEAGLDAASDEPLSPRHTKGNTGQDLMSQILARDNMQRAWKRVKANKGAAGIDGKDIPQTV